MCDQKWLCASQHRTIFNCFRSICQWKMHCNWLAGYEASIWSHNCKENKSAAFAKSGKLMFGYFIESIWPECIRVTDWAHVLVKFTQGHTGVRTRKSGSDSVHRCTCSREFYPGTCALTHVSSTHKQILNALTHTYNPIKLKSHERKHRYKLHRIVNRLWTHHNSYIVESAECISKESRVNRSPNMNFVNCKMHSRARDKKQAALSGSPWIYMCNCVWADVRARRLMVRKGWRK